MRAYGERNAQNSPLQGSAADLIKLAMIRIHAALREGKLRSRMLLQVHDELVFEAPPEEIETLGRAGPRPHGARRRAACAARGGHRGGPQLAGCQALSRV